MLLAQKVFTCLNKCALRYKTYNLGSRNANTASLGSTSNLIKGDMQWSGCNISNIHRHLCNAVLVNIPANSLSALKCTWAHYWLAILVSYNLTHDRISLTNGATLLTNIKSDSICPTSRGCIEVKVYCNKKIASTHSCSTRTSSSLIPSSCAKVWSRSRIAKTLREALILTLATNCKILTLRGKCRSLVAVGRHGKFIGNTLCQRACKLCALLERYASNGHKRQHISCSHTRMSTLMLTHIYKLCSTLNTRKSSLNNRLRSTRKGDNSTVSSLTRVYIKQLNICSSGDCRGN